MERWSTTRISNPSRSRRLFPFTDPGYNELENMLNDNLSYQRYRHRSSIERVQRIVQHSRFVSRAYRSIPDTRSDNRDGIRTEDYLGRELLYGSPSGAVDRRESRDRHEQRHQVSSGRNNRSYQRSNNLQHSARASPRESTDSTERNWTRAFAYFTSVEEETVILDSVPRADNEHEQPNDDIYSTLMNEETRIFDGISITDENQHEEVVHDYAYFLNLIDQDILALDEAERVERVNSGLSGLAPEALWTPIRVNSGLSRQTGLRRVKTRTHTTSRDRENLKEVDKDEEDEVCAICHGEYENTEIIGTLKCGHEYHAGCIEKWLLKKNNCPICRAPATCH